MPTLHMAKFISENFPLRGKDAGNALRRYFAGVVSPAAQAQMTEDDVMQMLNDEK